MKPTFLVHTAFLVPHTCLLISLLTIIHSQICSQELLANGNFEEENICTEYSKNCAPEAWIGNAFAVNYYFETQEWAENGSHFIGLIAGSDLLSSRRSFIRSHLLCSLRKGHQYKLEFYVRSRHPVFDSIGVYFSSTDFLFEKRPYTMLTPSLIFHDTASAPDPDVHRWRKITFDYTATGEEIFITIGSFKKQEFKYKLPPEYKGYYYLYLDAVTLVPEDKHELLCAGADSMKTIIYDENERHSILERKVTRYRKDVPAEPSPPVTLIQKIDTLIIPDILFATASAKLNEKSFRVLDSFCTALKARKVDSLVIEGHTDSVGTLIYNNKLSSERAISVSSYIKAKSTISQNRFMVHYYAYLRPVVSNLTTTGRQRNRRVEIYLYTHED
jgi:outer membrane protein OmpA-like peptidoglycan-associated protein